MKGHSSNSRFRLKTKSVHGVRTGEHNNPHVMKAARRADGGMCDGKPASRNLARGGRLKAKRVGRQDGGGLGGLGFNPKAAGAALTQLGQLGIPQPGNQNQTMLPDQSTELSGIGRNLMGLGARKRGGSVNKRNGGQTDRQKIIGEMGRADASSVQDTDDVRGKQSRQSGGEVALEMQRKPKKDVEDDDEDEPEGRANGGKVASELAADLERHHLEHALLAAEKDDDDEPEERKDGGRLTAEARKHIAPKNFALPGRRYPIEDASHARNALARVSQYGSSEEKAKVRAKVHAKYPNIGKDD